MSLIDLTLAGVALSTACPEAVVTNVNRPLAGAVRDEFTEVPGRDGAWVYDEEPGEILLTFDIAVLVDAPSQRRAAIATLRSWARTPSGRAQLIVSDEADRFWDVKLASAPPLVDDETVGVTQLVLSARPNPYATTASEQAIEAAGSPDSGTFNLDLDTVAEPIIEITPTNGTITSFVLSVNGAEVAWQDGSAGDPSTIAQAETITISTLSQTVTLAANVDVNLTGAFDPDDVDMASVAITGFPDLVDGTNEWSLSWTGTATTVDVDFTWRERFN